MKNEFFFILFKYYCNVKLYRCGSWADEKPSEAISLDTPFLMAMAFTVPASVRVNACE